VAAQSLTETAHVQTVLDTAEAIAGPVLLLAVFLVALMIGINASSPIEHARRRQLEFTADASHELRTPLSVIEAETSLVLSAPDRDVDEYRDTLERVGREGRRLRRIVEDLLWLARFDSEPSAPSFEAVNLSAIASGCAERFAAVADARGIDLSVKTMDTGEAWIEAPPQWIDRLAGVLVDNACRYAARGGTVVITTALRAPRVTLVVEDDGPGIPPQDRVGLFDRFHRATDEGTGSGLGLAIADAVVSSTGGRWSIGESRLGGARMEVSWHGTGADTATAGRVAVPLEGRDGSTTREQAPLGR
jgi:signal transduction histidine kinase